MVFACALVANFFPLKYKNGEWRVCLGSDDNDGVS